MSLKKSLVAGNTTEKWDSYIINNYIGEKKMRYIGSLQEVETIANFVQKKAYCMTVKPLPKESEFGTMSLLVLTGKDVYAFDLKLIFDKRNNIGEIKIDNNSLGRLCNISPEIAQAVSKMKPKIENGNSIKIQQFNGKAVEIPTYR